MYTYEQLGKMLGKDARTVNKRVNLWRIPHYYQRDRKALLTEDQALELLQKSADNLIKKNQVGVYSGAKKRTACYPPKMWHGNGGELFNKEWDRLKIVDYYLRQPLRCGNV